jgi:hypothetical protein
MTVKFPRWFGVPPELIELGHFAKLADSSKTLYVFLCFISDKRSSRQFPLKDATIVDMAGISKGTLSTARKKLSDSKLIVCDREPGGQYTYTLCDLKTGKPFPGLPKEKVRYEKPSAPTVETADETPTAPPVVSAVTIAPAVSIEATDVELEGMGWACIEGLDSFDNSFAFGWNSVTPELLVCEVWPVHSRQGGSIPA